MPSITAVLHTHNDASRLGRALETLCPCDEILVIDHESQDDTQRIAKEYGAKIVCAAKDSANLSLIHSASDGWIFCLDPRESLTEALSATLYEWKSGPTPRSDACFAVLQREETSAGWIRHSTPQARLVPPRWSRWNGCFPVSDSSSPVLDGELLRFAFP